MTDLEMMKLCAEAMGMIVRDHGVWIEAPAVRPGGAGSYRYNPLHDDAQAMALVKRLRLSVSVRTEPPTWYVGDITEYERTVVCSDDLNRAIVECVAKIHYLTVRKA